MTPRSRDTLAIQTLRSSLHDASAPGRRIIVRHHHNDHHHHEQLRRRRRRDDDLPPQYHPRSRPPPLYVPPPIEAAAPPSPTWEQLLGEVPGGGGDLHAAACLCRHCRGRSAAPPGRPPWVASLGWAGWRWEDAEEVAEGERRGLREHVWRMFRFMRAS